MHGTGPVAGPLVGQSCCGGQVVATLAKIEEIAQYLVQAAEPIEPCSPTSGRRSTWQMGVGEVS